LLSLTIIAGFFLMLLLPCAFAVFSAREREDQKDKRQPASRNELADGPQAASWRAARPAAPGSYDLEPRPADRPMDPPLARPKANVPAAAPQTPLTRRTRGASTLLGLAAEAEADSIAAQVYAAQANKAALEAIARSAAARAAAATALAEEAQRAVAEAARLAAAVRRAYETAPPSVGPERHALPESHPSMDFPRSHVIRRAA
jgi:hypothetical protein